MGCRKGGVKVFGILDGRYDVRTINVIRRVFITLTRLLKGTQSRCLV